MNEETDSQLLQRYAESRSEDAFASLVSRHVDFVYSAALRMVRDAHLAEDVTQTVFVALAKNAAPLAERPVLAGWLHRTAQNIAAQTVRTIERRRAREQGAVAMNELLSAESDSTWEDVAPHLDVALGELSEPDRDAVLLRYFQRRSAREIAQALGVTEDAAQKRVNRAVDRLRDNFARQGFTLGATGLVALISANAVQAAPAGLALTISTTAGTTLTATAATVTKAITMTTLQKTLITATVAVLAGAGLYQTFEVSLLRERNEALDQQQSQLPELYLKMQRERDAATNGLATVKDQLAMANAENARLKSGQNELFKLRGQVGTLRQQLTSAEARSNLISLEKIMADPRMKELTIQSSRREIKLRFAELFEELKLTPEQIETFGQTVANNGLGLGEGQTALTATEVETRLRSLLGDAGFARFQEFTQEVPVRATLNQLKSQLGGDQLTSEQTSRLWQIVKGEPFDLTYGIEGDGPKAATGSPDEVSHYLQQVAESNQRIAQQAGAFLSPNQLAALNTVLTNALKARTAQAAAFQKHE